MDYSTPEVVKPVDRRKVMESYFPEFLRSNLDYKVFIKVASEELGIVSDYIELFTNLPNVDETPEKFLQSLGEMVGYSYIDEVDPEAQRELIKRIFNKHEARGGIKDLEMMASNAPNNGYIGGDLFVPGTYKIGQDAVITFPRDTLYTWNKSKRSSYDRYPDGISAIDGVIEILIGYIDDNVKARCETVKPAGVKLSFKMSVVISVDDDVLKIRLPKLYTGVNLWMYSQVNCRRTARPQDNAWSGRGSRVWRSGFKRQWLHVGPEINVGVSAKNEDQSILGEYYPEKGWDEILKDSSEIPMQVIKAWKGPPVWSVNSVRSGKYGRSGMRTGVIEANVPFRHPMNLDNNYIFLGEVSDKPINGYSNPEEGNKFIKVDVEEVTE